MVSSTGFPAMTNRMILRGFLSLEIKSSWPVDPIKGRLPSAVARWTVRSTLEGVRLPTTTWKPWEAMLRAKFCPITARPQSPTSHDSFVDIVELF